LNLSKKELSSLKIAQLFFAVFLLFLHKFFLD